MVAGMPRYLSPTEDGNNVAMDFLKMTVAGGVAVAGHYAGVYKMLPDGWEGWVAGTTILLAGTALMKGASLLNRGWNVACDQAKKLSQKTITFGSALASMLVGGAVGATALTALQCNPMVAFVGAGITAVGHAYMNMSDANSAASNVGGGFSNGLFGGPVASGAPPVGAPAFRGFAGQASQVPAAAWPNGQMIPALLNTGPSFTTTIEGATYRCESVMSAFEALKRMYGNRWHQDVRLGRSTISRPLSVMLQLLIDKLDSLPRGQWTTFVHPGVWSRQLSANDLAQYNVSNEVPIHSILALAITEIKRMDRLAASG